MENRIIVNERGEAWYEKPSGSFKDEKMETEKTKPLKASPLLIKISICFILMAVVAAVYSSNGGYRRDNPEAAVPQDIADQWTEKPVAPRDDKYPNPSHRPPNGQNTSPYNDTYTGRIFQSETETEWGKIRSRAWIAVEAGKMNLPSHKLYYAQKTLKRWKKFQHEEARLHYAKHNGKIIPLTSERTEAVFAKYIMKDADMAALWGFVVINFMDEEEFGDFLLKSRDVKPYHGYMLYMKRTRYQNPQSAKAWATSEDVNNAVGRMCPA